MKRTEMFNPSSWLLVVGLMSLVLPVAAKAQEKPRPVEDASNPIVAELRKALTTHDEDLKTLKQAIIETLDRLETTKSDALTPEQIAKNRKAIEGDEVEPKDLPLMLPKGADRARIKDQLISRRKKLETAYRKAESEARRTGQNELADRYKGDLADHLKVSRAVREGSKPDQPIVMDPNKVVDRVELEERLEGPPPANKKPRVFPLTSAWNFVYSLPNGVSQPGAFRVADGELIQINAKRSVGQLQQDDAGVVHLNFLGHPKIASGTAVVQFVKPGEWAGELEMGNSTFLFTMKRR